MSRKISDFGLWTEVTKSVKPLRRRKPISPSPAREATVASHFIAPSKSPVPRKIGRTTASPPPVTGFDRRTTQKMTRGNVAIERRLDLHGMGIELARVALLQFLRAAYDEGARTVLVITGKGASPFARHTLHGATHFHAPERQGRLRRLLPEWLHEPEFRLLVSGFQPAHPKHGGGGAYYVKIRRVKG